MTWLHYLKDCAEINKMLNASIKSLATIHWPLSTIHLATPPPHTTIRIIQGETGVFQASQGAPSAVCTLMAPNKTLQDAKKHFPGRCPARR